jgi:hypothetical protein
MGGTNMTDLKDTLRDAQQAAISGIAGERKVLTEPHSQWMELNESEQVYSYEAKIHVWDALSKKYKHPRIGRFGLSSLGMCPRRVVFGYAGAPQAKPSAEGQAMMDNGTWAHLQWQAEGLTTGMFTDAEAWVFDKDLRAGGSRDATIFNGENFELKSANQNVYKKIVGIQRSPKYENLLQDAAYKLLGDLPVWSSIVYENRDLGKFHEFRVGRDTKLETEVVRLFTMYGLYVDSDELPPMLEDCVAKTGWTYKGCPYMKTCAKAKAPSEFGNLS